MINFTKTAKKALNYAQGFAKDSLHPAVGTEHILVGLTLSHEGVASKVLSRHNITENRICEKISELVLVKEEYAQVNIDFTPRAKKILELSLRESIMMGTKYVGTEHILMAILKDRDCLAAKIIMSLSIDPKRIFDEMLIMLGYTPVGTINQREIPINVKGGATSLISTTPTLDKFSRDFTELANEQKFDPIIGREQEIERIIQILSRRTKNNPCLVGEPGVGKTAVVEGLSQKIVSGKIPQTLKGKRVVALDIALMVAGTKYRGEFEERIKKTIEEATQSGDVILFIDEIHTIIGAGGAGGSLDAANILKPSLARGELQLIGATTQDEYRKYIEKDTALERRFQSVTVEEPTIEEAVKILNGLKDKYEAHHNVSIDEKAIEVAVNLSARYIHDRCLPDKAIDLIDEAASRVRLKSFIVPPAIEALEKELEQLEQEKESAIRSEEFKEAGKIKAEQEVLKEQLKIKKDRWNNSNSRLKKTVTDNDIAEILTSWTGLPVKKLQEEESEKLMNLELELHKRVVGQEEAITAVSKAIRRGRVGLKDPNRPIGSFLFLGPTGVGKTELCKALAEVLFGDESAMIRVDMSEFMEPHSSAKLIGSPPGYVGYDDGGHLSERVRKKPYCVLLFDEIEKAHQDVFNVLLQVLDDGHLTDSKGRKVDFKNAVIIMTSNAGARSIVSPKKLGFNAMSSEKENYKNMKSNVMDEVKKMFRPEFLNRIDDIIVFHQLTEIEIKDIVKILADSLIKRVKQNMDIKLTFEQSAIDVLAKEGFDEAYGARPLRRAIQTMVEDLFAEEYLTGKFTKRKNLKVSTDEDKIIIK